MQKRSKGGLSTIVVTLIIILISLVAVGIIWIVVRNVIQAGTEGVSFGQFMLNAKIMDANVDNSTNNVSVMVKRNAGQGELVGMKFVFSDGKNSEVITEEFSMNELEQRGFTFHLNNLNVSNLESISIFPILKQEEKQVTGGVLDQYMINKGKKPRTCTPSTNCSALGYVCGTWSNGTCLGTLNCGTCSGGLTCNATGGCQAGCTPQTCASLGYQCGSGYANGTCGGSLDCGTCSGGYDCVGGNCILQISWQFDWNIRTDKYGKPAGYFDITPFPIDETTLTYIISNDEGNHTYYLGTKYFVDAARPDDSGNGLTLATAKKTIDAAITAAGNGNKIILVRTGTYNIASSITVGNGINDTNRWIISGYGQERPVIRGVGLSDNIIKGISKSYATIQRLKIQDSEWEGISTDTSDRINLIDVWVYNTTSITPIKGDGGIHLHQTQNVLITHVTVEHTYDHCIKVGDNDNNAIVEWNVVKECGYWPGIPLVTSGTACGFDFPSDAPQEPQNAILRYNIASDVLFEGAQIRRQNNYSIHHNEFYNSPNMDAVTGERSHATNEANVVIHQTSYGNFYSNIIRSGPDGEGIADSSCTDCLAIGLGLQSNSIQTSNIYNNLFYDVAMPIFVYGYTGDGLVQHYNIYSNSIYSNSNTTLVYIPSGTVTLGEDTVSLRNNIIYQNGANVNSKAAELDSDVIHQYNQYYAPSSSIGVTLSTGEFDSNPQWQSNPSGTYSSSEAALTLNSPAINNGTSLSSLFTSSFNGVSRPQGSGWDIGAYEYL